MNALVKCEADAKTVGGHRDEQVVSGLFGHN